MLITDIVRGFIFYQKMEKNPESFDFFVQKYLIEYKKFYNLYIKNKIQYFE